MTVGQRDYLQAWQGRCYEAGLIGCDYPVEYGGRGHHGFQSIANQALGKARVPFMINVVGLNMAAPTILQHGTEELNRSLLRRDQLKASSNHRNRTRSADGTDL